MKKTLSLSFALAAVALMSGCFGGGDDDAPMPAPPPPAPAPPDPLAAVPDSATQSTDGLVAYLKTLSTNSSETREPIDLNRVTLPQSDTAEPAAL
ncbi:hypothetical protein [Aquabacterium sp.]|uniref:hypothetical protein n=1 Tax=Aquabacterium sp. TaxID=1872578 RepID=UPI002BB571CE|nr:hypothetical protein [Aquabacterium sp.]HSW07511.1 hypothetical protein [Aquabacterium sp.]